MAQILPTLAQPERLDISPICARDVEIGANTRHATGFMDINAKAPNAKENSAALRPSLEYTGAISCREAESFSRLRLYNCFCE